MKYQRARLLHHLIGCAEETSPDSPALLFRDESWTFGQLSKRVERFAQAICGMGLAPDERVAVYLPKQFETVLAIFGAAAAGGVTVPINPMLKAAQVAHILKDCNVRVLITSGARAKQLKEILPGCHDLNTVILTSGELARETEVGAKVIGWEEFDCTPSAQIHPRIDSDMAAILYTSGSTGLPKGVVLSHHNMVAAAESSAEFLELSAEDRLLAVLPLSFDYGLSQLTTAYSVGASVVLFDYLLPKELVQAVSKYAITGISAVPPIWNQLAVLEWPETAARCLRYITTSGGAARRATLEKLRKILPHTGIYQMYGLTEAFRSAFLPPEEFEQRPGSVGKAIPNVELMVVREDGSVCAPDEPGELVHRGSLVAMGYWNDEKKTSERFRPCPTQSKEVMIKEIVVWSGDQMRMDEEGYLYFVSRQDEMIKTSGYRVSPTEVEEVVFASGLVAEAVALGVPHGEKGQAIILLANPADGKVVDEKMLSQLCAKQLPTYMIPDHIDLSVDLPRNPNGKIDRALLAKNYRDYFVKS